MPEPIPAFSADDGDVDLFYQEFYQVEELPPEQDEAPVPEVAESLDLEDLFGVDPALPLLVSAALRTKQHLIVHGPRGPARPLWHGGSPRPWERTG